MERSVVHMRDKEAGLRRLLESSLEINREIVDDADAAQPADVRVTEHLVKDAKAQRIAALKQILVELFFRVKRQRQAELQLETRDDPLAGLAGGAATTNCRRLFWEES